MTRTTLQPYRETGKGLFEIGDFRVQAEWVETGKKQFHHSATLDGVSRVPGLKDNVEFRIQFGDLSPGEVDALLVALDGDEFTPRSIKLAGKSMDMLYLHGAITDGDDDVPTGLVFSNRPPR